MKPLSYACALAVLMLGACSRGAKTEEAAGGAAPTPVTTAAVEIGSITAVLQANGLVTAAPGAEQIVTAPEQARIVEMPKGEREVVQRGDLLVRFELPSVESENAKGNVEVARAEAGYLDNAGLPTRARRICSIRAHAAHERRDAESQIAADEAELRSARTLAAGQAGPHEPSCARCSTAHQPEAARRGRRSAGHERDSHRDRSDRLQCRVDAVC
jgi:hypothetical protein